MQQDNSTRIKTLILSDNSKKEEMNFTFSSEIEITPNRQRNVEFSIKGDMPYMEYRIMYKLLEVFGC